MIYLVIFLVIIFFLFLLWLFPIVQVCGMSMYPTLEDGEYLLARRVIRKGTKYLKLNAIYIYIPPVGESRRVIKRLVNVHDKELIFYGDNQSCSYDSHDYGGVSPKRVIAKVIYRKQVKA